MKQSLIGAALAMLLCGCAAITTGTSQSIAVESKPDGAECTLANDKGKWFAGETPESVTVKRSYSALNVTCRKGRLSGSRSLQSTTKGAAFGNIIFGGIIGGAVDMGSGAAYDYPPGVLVKMK